MDKKKNVNPISDSIHVFESLTFTHTTRKRKLEETKSGVVKDGKTSSGSE